MTNLVRRFPLHQTGATLVEILMAVMLMALGILAMTAMQAQALQVSQGSQWRSKADLLSQDLSNRIRAHGELGTDIQAYAVDPTSGHIPTPVDCSGSTLCNVHDMTTSDLHNWLTDIAASLPEGQGHVEVNGLKVDIWVVWQDASAQPHSVSDHCPNHLIVTSSTRCLHTEVSL